MSFIDRVRNAFTTTQQKQKRKPHDDSFREFVKSFGIDLIPPSRRA